MNTRSLTSLSILAACLAVVAFSTTTGARARQDPKQAPPDMAAMLAKAKRFTEPGANHKHLERFLGKWDIENRITMAGQESPPEKGTAEFSWIMDGRWIKGESNGTLMGQPLRTFTVIGYDNFKQSFVTSMVSSMDTAMTHAEGDMDPAGSAIITYGQMDEYLTGEVGKMVKYVWRFPSKDKIILEVHDLPIGEKNTKVVEVVYTRQP